MSKLKTGKPETEHGKRKAEKNEPRARIGKALKHKSKREAPPHATPAGAPRVSIVIRAYNEEKHIGRLLSGILQQTEQDVEVILVDSGSSDATVAIAASVGSRCRLKVVHILPENFTFGYSLNQGIAQASGELIVIASAHVYPVYPDWLERLLAPFGDSVVGLTYGRQSGNGSSHFSEHQVFAQWFPARSLPRQPHPFCNNANAAIRRRLWEKHPYDESLSGLEDLDWAHWVMNEGYTISYVAEAEVVHVHEETPKGIYNRYRREGMAFKRIFPQERFGFADFLRMATTNILSDWVHARQAGVLRLSWSSIVWFRWMQFWGTYQGYRQAGPLTWQLRQTFYYPRKLSATQEGLPRTVKPIRYNDIET